VIMPQQPPSTVATTVERLGLLSILVNNAGIIRDRTFHDPDERWGLLPYVALRTAFRATVAARPPVRESAKQETADRGTRLYRRRATPTGSSAAVVRGSGARCL